MGAVPKGQTGFDEALVCTSVESLGSTWKEQVSSRCRSECMGRLTFAGDSFDHALAGCQGEDGGVQDTRPRPVRDSDHPDRSLDRRNSASILSNLSLIQAHRAKICTSQGNVTMKSPCACPPACQGPHSESLGAQNSLRRARWARKDIDLLF